MNIDDQKFKLTKKNYVEVETSKKQIIFGHGSDANTNYIKWSHRHNGYYKKTSAFTIDKNGKVYEHFDPKYYSNFLGNAEIDRKSIVILLENDGWLVENPKKNGFINWIGYIYNKPEGIVEKKWRNYAYWAPYTTKQFKAALELAANLCEEFEIPKMAMSNNVQKIEDLNTFTGIMYKSNLEKHYTDLSPAWDAEGFKTKLEKK